MLKTIDKLIKNKINLKSYLRNGVLANILIGTLGMSSCDLLDMVNKPPIAIPPLNQVYEGELYSYQVRAYDPEWHRLEYSLKENTANSSAPKWPVPLSINNSGLVTGTAPQVDEDTNYKVEIDISDGVNVTEQNYDLTVINLKSSYLK